MNADIMRRLSIVRQMYISGISDAQRPSPLNALAILPLYDAVEMFMQIAAEYKQVNMPRKADFDQYWTVFSSAGIELGSREGMSRLNSARVTLKHSGIIPDRAEIGGFSEMVTNFLGDNTVAIFNVNFKSLSRAFLIGDAMLRDLVEAGEAAMQRSDHASAMENLKVAFDKAITFGGSDAFYDPQQGLWRSHNGGGVSA